jgi:hypothetical protein
MLDHDVKKVWMIIMEGEGDPRERGRRELFLSTLERERQVKNEYFGPKPLKYPFRVKFPLCPCLKRV